MELWQIAELVHRPTEKEQILQYESYYTLYLDEIREIVGIVLESAKRGERYIPLYEKFVNYQTIQYLRNELNLDVRDIKTSIDHGDIMNTGIEIVW